MTRRLKSNRFLPAYVTSFKDRHGKVRLRYRRKGHPDHYFQAALGTEAFRAEYRACEELQEAAPIASERAALGSLADLRNRYFAVPDRLGPTETTRIKVRSIIERFCEGRADRPVSLITFEAIEKILAKTRVKRTEEGRPVGGVEAARKLRKELVRFFDFGLKIGLMTSNPAAQAERIKVAPAERSKGFHTWTEDEIAQYRQRHQLGGPARLAMELMLWTDQRKVDSIHLGRQHIRDGRFHLSQTKTGKALAIMVAPQLLEAIVAMPKQREQMCFLVNEWGRPFTSKGFGNRFRKWCDDAGLPHCTAHGLRKATMRRMAELEMPNKTMKSLSGHTKDDEVARYTEAANQQRLADGAIATLAKWEKSNPRPRLDVATTEGTANAC